MKKLMTIFGTILFASVILTSCSDESCGCSDQDLTNYAQGMNVTIDEAKAECCWLQKIADEMNSEK